MESINCDDSYIVGLLQTDGHLHEYKGKGKLSIELSEKDADIIYRIAPMINSTYSITKRVRTTNFKENYVSVLLTVCTINVRKKYKEYGLPVGKKSNIIAPPEIPYFETDYYRGIIDGDGSVGITSTNKPFISLFTKSRILIESYKQFVLKITGIERNVSVNKRDNIYSICSFNEEAVFLTTAIYYRNLAISRKYQNAQQVMQWQRPIKIKKRNTIFKKWTNEEDAFILSHNIDDSILQLQRSKQSIKTRLWRLMNSNK